MNATAETTGGHEESRPGESLASYIETLRRRAVPMSVAFGAVFALALLLAVFWPPTCLSKGTILIEQQEIPQDYVRSAISSFADERVQVISQRVMTSANLLGIIERFGLYADDQDTLTREEMVERMREDIDLQLISADVVDPRQGHATKATIAFSVGYKAPSSQTAARVANDIVSLYLTENLETRKQQAETPAVEKDYVALVREVESEQAKYNELRQKQLTAQLAQNLETEQKGERFTLIEPPMAPEDPVSPNRKAILALDVLWAVLLRRLGG